MELEENGRIPFLDILISKRNDSTLSHEVHRKKTHTDRYVHAKSHHHPVQKIGVINTLVTRAMRLSDEEHIEQELRHLKEVFIANGYNEEQVNRAILKAKRTPRTENSKEEVTKNINLPYIKGGTTEKIAKILRKENIKVSFSPPNSLRTMLDHAKDSINPSLHRGVYSIPCTCGKQYIGETGRSFFR